MRPVIFFMEREIGNPEIGGEIHHQLRRCGKNLRRQPRRFAVLEREENDIRAPRRFGRGLAAEDAIT